ncbi:iron ABC transporter ATP-binding protein [Staphylococcus borealis]|uniref:iron ABC transporter ATP-binding protein n=1 Tax=Staphylococcus borealis TaxID=2742203 RepID=UPI000D1F41AF|nr:ATP-binding cassette domain-containing protein [Staphylococcus borealis]RIO93893.1 ATP-binding cassette domain-containing protein [Staphylococcus haemolyticus]MDM7882546.1 ATP-binding cassette domain-containing protein [Staphylococcus borealis]MDY4022595.1 ATP-binding cassette domain-containing protein [Staphylococcus borealis]PTK67229.1 iron ABC transporter ATP-binding protein [Staphylococcus borealis]RIO72339.1 ATP-binding cassette domain-containing protein [Staphylococcus borealis]
MIEIKNLDKAIQNKPILKNINVDIQKGRLTSLIGPNGAGKSTLLSAVSRLFEYEKGSIKIEGKAVDDYKSDDLAKKLSILKQTNHTDMNITIEQLVNFGRFPYSKGRMKKEDHEQVEYALDLLQLQNIRHRNIKTLSGGQRQRAYIAMTIAQDTDYILLDEPLNNLDMKHSVQIMQTLRRLCKDLNKTIVIVLHDINFASCYSDDIIALKDGEIVKADTRDNVIQTDILKQLYEMDVHIEEIRGQRICLYYDEITFDSLCN